MDFDIGLQRAIFASMQSHFEFARAVAAHSRPTMSMQLPQPSRSLRTQPPPPAPTFHYSQQHQPSQQHRSRRDIAPTIPPSGGARGSAVVTYGKRSTLAREGILPTTCARTQGTRAGGKGASNPAVTSNHDDDNDAVVYRDDDNTAPSPRGALVVHDGGDSSTCVPGWVSRCTEHARVQWMPNPREGGALPGQMFWITDELFNGMVNVLPEACVFVSEVGLSYDANSTTNALTVQVQSLVPRGRYGCVVVGWRWTGASHDARKSDAKAEDDPPRENNVGGPLDFVGVTIHFDASGSVLASVDEFTQRSSSSMLEKVRVLQPPANIRLLRDRVHVTVARVSQCQVRVSLQGSDEDFLLPCGAGRSSCGTFNNGENDGSTGVSPVPIVATSGGRFSLRNLKIESSSSALAAGGRRPESKRQQVSATATSSSPSSLKAAPGRTSGTGPPPTTTTTDLPANVDRELAARIEQEIVDRGPCVEWDDVVGMPEAKRLLKEAVVLPLLVPELFTGVLQPWKGVLMYGPPGTGKTMLAKAVAASAHTTFFNMSASVLLHKHFGESEKMIRTLFQVARARSPSTIFFDEIDAIMSSRGGAQEHDAMRRIKAELLTQIDGLHNHNQPQHGSSNSSNGQARVMILATTNRPWDLDDAMRRRLEKRIYIGLPDLPTRIDMLTKMCRQLVIQPSVQLADIASRTEGFCGADLNQLVRNAGMMPVRRLLAGKTPDEIAAMKLRGEAVLGAVTAEDFALALQSTSSSVRQDSLKEYEDWSSEFAST